MLCYVFEDSQTTTNMKRTYVLILIVGNATANKLQWLSN